MDHLPIELWLLIADHISDNDFLNLIGVNKFFFDLGLDRKYRDIRLDDPAAFKKLDRLRYVNRTYILLWALV